MTPEQLTAAGFQLCTSSPGPYWPGDAFAPLYVCCLDQGSTIYVQCLLEHPDEIVAFVGDWDRPQHYCHGVVRSMEQLLRLLGLAEAAPVA